MEMTRFLALTVILVVSHVFTQVPGGESTMDNSHVRGTFKCTGPRNSPPKRSFSAALNEWQVTVTEGTKTQAEYRQVNEHGETADADVTHITTLAEHDTTKSTERPDFTTKGRVKNQSMYWISDDKATWTEAVDRCRNVSNNGHLVHIDNEEENNEVKAFREQTLGGFTWIWIGIHDSENEGEWTYEDGSNHTYVNWRNGEPNGYENENCAVMSKVGDYIDGNCEWKYQFCCEYYVVI